MPGAGELAHWVKVLATKSEDQSSIPLYKDRTDSVWYDHLGTTWPNYYVKRFCWTLKSACFHEEYSWQLSFVSNEVLFGFLWMEHPLRMEETLAIET